MSETNSSFNANDSEALYLDNTAYSNSVKEILLSGSELEFNPSAFDMENEINGTESMNTLISYWHSVSDTTGSYRLLLQNSVDPALNKVQKSVNDTNVNVSLALALANISSVLPFTTPSGLKSAKDYIDLYIDLYNESLKLTDGDPSNDADALARMNKLLNNCIVVYDESGQKILAYDTYFIDFVIDRTPESDLIHQLFSDLKENMPSNNKIATFNESEPFEYSLTISQHNAGYQLNLSANGKLEDNEIDNQMVAYAATKETCNQFFYTDGALNWDNIDTWLKSAISREQSYEYFFFADVMQNLSNEELSKILELGQIDYAYYPGGSYCYETSEVLPRLAEAFVALVQTEAVSGKQFPDEYTFRSIEAKSIAFFTAVSNMSESAGAYVVADFSSEKTDKGEKYSVHYSLHPNSSTAQTSKYHVTKDCDYTFTVYPKVSEMELEAFMDQGVQGGLTTPFLPYYSMDKGQLIASKFWADAEKYVAKKAFGIATSKLDPFGLIVDSMDFSEQMANHYDQYDQAMKNKALSDSLDYGNGAMSLAITGNVISSAGDKTYVDVWNPSFNMNTLSIRIAAYNDSTGNEITQQDLIQSFYENGDIYKKYNSWYIAPDTDAYILKYEVAVQDVLSDEFRDTPIEDLSPEKICEAIEIVRENR